MPCGVRGYLWLMQFIQFTKVFNSLWTKISKHKTRMITPPSDARPRPLFDPSCFLPLLFAYTKLISVLVSSYQKCYL